MVVVAGFSARAESAATDPYQWLEDIDSAKSMAWVQEHNAATARRLTADPDYAARYHDALAVLDSASRIPGVDAHGAYVYNLWQDSAHPRGLYRRTTPAELRKANPVWETVLDVDALAAKEGKPWAFGGAIWRRSDEARCLIQLSPGGGDAVELREFDVTQLEFVRDGFRAPVAKSRVTWCDENSLYIATDFGPGSLTESGYPRILKRWKRGTALADAEVVTETPAQSVLIQPRTFGAGKDRIALVEKALTYWRTKFFLVSGKSVRPLDIPEEANVVDAINGRLIIWLKSDWSIHGTKFASGSVVIVDLAALEGGSGSVDLLFAPTAAHVIDHDTVAEAPSVHVISGSVLITSLDSVRGRLDRYTLAGNTWQRTGIPFPDNGSISVATTNDDSGDAWIEYESFTTPPTLYFLARNGSAPEKVKSQEPTFDGSRFETRQLWCTSADGTKVPYFVVGPKGMKEDGSNPVWMFSYGGFEIALKPAYSGSYEDLHGAYGKLWLERDGVFVLANIRGGGDFGPAWHQAALKENHYKAFEDFEAVARDLVARKITSPAHLGIEGRSNGGLLVASTMLRHPELYGAVVCGNPLIDMQRYHKLLAGASWMAEYGNPDLPEEWASIREYSPYQNLTAGKKLPPIMFYTSTRDDRVHPGHARKMAAKMEALGYETEYFENTEGGHHGSVTNEQLATRLARTYTFLWQQLGRR
jgi:prolyl oligopeptidase